MTLLPTTRQDELSEWLLAQARALPDMGTILSAFCQRLVSEGFPLYRLNVSIPTLHPQIAANSFRWIDGAPSLRETAIDFSVRASDDYLRSPLRRIYEGIPEIRAAIPPGREPLEYPILDDLREEGVSEYIALPLIFSSGRVNALTLATRAPGGFDDQQLARFKALLPLLALVLEVKEDQRVAKTLLEVYLGRDAGQRVLGGLVRRGEGKVIAAALWHCDLRDFTRFSNETERETVIETLNAYFDVMAGPVEAHGGEILKFIGDAMLAIFPIADDLDRDRACRTALVAAEEAIIELGRLNRVRREQQLSPLDTGIALHTGTVTYGNIGTANRLDFTVIGPAVNLVTRIGALCPILNRSVLASERAASPCGSKMVPVGSYRLKGIDEPQIIYGLPG